MDSLELTQELLSLDKEMKLVEQQMQELKNRKRKLAERKEQLEKALQHSVDVSESNKDAWESANFPWSPKLVKNLRDKFKIDEFREFQLSAMNATLSKEDVVLIMSTGGGKSLCYQLPATIENGFTLVVSPLISLMEDQMFALKLSKFGIKGAVLSQSVGQKDVASIQASMLDASSDLKLVFVTPEKLAKSKRFMSKLEKCYETNRLQRIAIDEVHCCSQWGHDFRPDYKFLNILRRMFPRTPILGLTATATGRVIDDVKNMLSIPGALTFRANFNRPNLFYEVRVKSRNCETFLDDLVQLISTRFVGQSGIVYCFSKKETEELASSLNSNGIKAACYHADLSFETRSAVHQKWYANSCQVIVATVAFGMGIDKPNVRFVVHQTIAKSVENYYQESGRAGRDASDAVCILYYRFADAFRQSSMVCTEKTGIDNLMTMVKYCNDVTTCRRKLIADHFGETWSLDWCTEKCDNCARKSQASSKVDVSKDARSLCGILRAADQKMTGNKLLETFSKANQQVSCQRGERLIVQLLVEDFLKLDFHFTPYNIITYVCLGVKSNLLLDAESELKVFMNEFDVDDSPLTNRKKRKMVKSIDESNCKVVVLE